MEKMLMNVHTGSVSSREEWLEVFNTCTPEEWGGENFEDAGLVEVVPDGEGGWKEAE